MNSKIEFKKFSSIEQFRNVIHYVNKYLTVSPIMGYTGTVKLHGTNAAIGILKDGTVYFQSRNNIITPNSDNAGFATYMANYTDIIKEHFHSPYQDIIIYGEWCGGNIQKNVGITGLTKMFVAFTSLLETEKMKELNDANIYSIYQFPTYEIAIDFKSPDASVAELVALTEAVEAQCPVANYFGVLGVGEGIVWVPVSQIVSSCLQNVPLELTDSMTFKVKGEKHAASKVKTLVSLTPEQMEEQNKIKDFISYAVTDNRVSQAIKETGAENQKDTGLVLKWVMQDIIKEESDTMEINGITPKLLGKSAPKAIKENYFKQIQL